MTSVSVQARLAALERKFEKLEASLEKQPWWEKLWGKYADDPTFEEAMRLGRAYRDSLDKKPAKRTSRKRSNARV